MRYCTSILLALVVLLSTTGLPRVQHLCGGIVQSVDLLLNTSGCAHDNAKAPICHAPKAMLKAESGIHAKPCCPSMAGKEDGCCTDQLEWEPSQQDLAISDQFDLETLRIVCLEPRIVSIVAWTYSEPITLTVRPPPPIRPTRRRALTQVYRC